jgi:hypothetical protein
VELADELQVTLIPANPKLFLNGHLARLCTFKSNNKQYQPDGQKETVVFLQHLVQGRTLKK